jgi:DNA polymerase elongation subunit (family B)
MGFRDIVNQHNPNVIVGYNIFKFDIPYLIDRANHKSIYPEWSQQGFAKGKSGIQREIKWSSSAYKHQEFKFLDCEGRLYIDLLPVVQRDFKLNDYKLKTVSTHFIGETKDDLDPKSIFRCYEEGIKDNSEKASTYMSVCGKYCMQDSMLVIKLMEKLNVWHGLTEMGVVCNVPMITLFTKGQQIKVYSSLYKYCLENNIIPEKDGYSVSENERYVGAYVFAPKPGLYKNVVPEDFSSLYPSLIIAYNIDYTSCVFDPTIPDELCHVMEWEDHISCKHDPKVIEKGRLTKTIDELAFKNKKTDKPLISQLRKQRSEITKSTNKNVMCEKRKYRFLKVTEENPEFKGVLPTIVQSLLDSRKETRKQMDKFKEILKNATDENERKELKTAIAILNQRQLAYKVSANSMYGITGVKAGMLPFMPVAMSITYMGRTNIMKVAEVIQTKYNGEIISGDTDSCYVSFGSLFNDKNLSELWDYAILVADEISKLFPPPVKLEFEEAIYTKFLILTKKRYMYKTALRDGTVKPEIGKRGVLLNRRDNCAFIRNTYENMVKIVFDHTESTLHVAPSTDVGKERLKQKVLSSLINDIDSMFLNQLPVEDFVITKSTGDYGKLKPQYFQNDKGLHRAILGQYNVPFLTDEIKIKEGIDTPQQETDWYLDKLPAHIQLLEKIRRRNHMSNEGSRLEYVIVETNNLKDKQSAKIETLNYYKKNKGVLNLDYLYYLNRLINPVDQVLEILFNLKDFMKNHYNHRLTKKKITIHINNLFAPKFDIEMDRLYLIRMPSKNKYSLVCGFKKECKRKIRDTVDSDLVLKLDYVPVDNLYNYMKSKYGANTSLKTQFIFKDNYIILGTMTESKLVSVIKRECKSV